MAQQSERIMDLISGIKPQDELYNEEIKMTSAVEWLFSQIPFEWSSGRDAYEALAIAKQMEKEQIIMAHVNGSEYSCDNAEQYYNETYSNNTPKTIL